MKIVSSIVDEQLGKDQLKKIENEAKIIQKSN